MSPRATVRRVGGSQLGPWLDDVARLRIAVFRDWPYLYDGHFAYEREYLAAYAKSADSVVVLAFDGDRVVGASTGLPLADDTDEFQRPWRMAGRSVDEVFYFGESMLLPEYRGQGIGHAFFDVREAHARELGRFACTAFCAVDRDVQDSRRPAGHRGNEGFWTKRPRPCAADGRIRAWIAPLDEFSFPSGHTLHAVSFTVVALAHYPVLAWLLLPFTASVAISRVVLGLHYPSDVLAATTIGVALASLSLWIAPVAA